MEVVTLNVVKCRKVSFIKTAVCLPVFLSSPHSVPSSFCECACGSKSLIRLLTLFCIYNVKITFWCVLYENSECEKANFNLTAMSTFTPRGGVAMRIVATVNAYIYNGLRLSNSGFLTFIS